MGRDGLQHGVKIRKVFIFSTRICYTTVCNHPFFVGILLMLLFLYRLSPFLFSLLVYFSPVLVCTALLLGILLSFGEPKLPLIDQDQTTLTEISESKTGSVENPICFRRDEGIDTASVYTEFRTGIVAQEPLLDTVGPLDVAHTSIPTCQKSREVEFGKPIISQVPDERHNLEKEIEKKSSLDDPKVRVGVDVGLSNKQVYENDFCENIDDYKSAGGSVDSQKRDQLGCLSGSWELLDDVPEDSLSPVQKVDVSSSHNEIHQNTQVETRNFDFEDYKPAQGSIDAQKTNHLGSCARLWEQSDDVVEDTLSPARKVQAAVLAQLRNQLECTIGSWNHFDVVVENRSSVDQKVQAENSDDYKSAEGSVDTQTSDQLESSFKAWNQLGFDHDKDEDEDEDEDEDGSDSGSESSSPDASMADIIPMLDELHPLLYDENQQTSDLSHHSSIHSGYESDQKEEEVGDIQSDDDQDEEAEGEEETQGNKQDLEKSAISWTADDQKNLMDLGTSELERNQRLESLIARRRARRMMVERNLIDFDSMDLQFQVAPISTTRRNPFDLPHDSYDDLGLPPIPGSAPSIMMPRRNPFDLPYDSSEEKPDLMGDSFQQEFMELYYQGEVSNPRDAVFRRNETFSMGSSSIFNFGARASRFRPYFVPERTDSDMMSYSSSLQRQSSELSESKASSAPEIESPYADRDGDEKKRDDLEFGQEMEPGSDNDQASLLAELGSHSSNDQYERDLVPQVPEIELGKEGSSPAEVSVTFDSQTQLEALMEERHSISSSSSSTPEEYTDLRVEDNVENDGIPSEPSLKPSNDFHDGTMFGIDHPREPVYDSSPQAVKNNPSSISSDLNIQRSEIHLCQLPSVGRDLLMTEEPKVHEHAEQCISDEKHGVVVNDQFLFSEISNNTESSVCPEYELRSSVDTSEMGLVEDKSPDNKVQQHEEKPILNQEHDYTGVCIEGKLDTTEIEDNKDSAIHETSFEDPIITSEERECSILEHPVSPVQYGALSLTGELKEDDRMENDEDQQHPVSRPDLANHDNNNNNNNMVESLVSTLDESLDFSHDFAIDCQNDNPEEQESTVDNSEVEEVGQVNNLDESLNIFAVEEPQENILPDPLQNDQPFFKPMNFEDSPVTEQDDEEHTDNDLSQELGVSLSDEKIIDAFNNGITENLLSELDVIGDFSVNMSFDFPEQVVSKSSPNMENSSLDESLLGDVFDGENFEPMTEIKEPDFVEFTSVTEEGVQNFEAELIRELLEASLETELLQEDIEPEVGIKQDDGSFEKIVESEAEAEAETEAAFAEPPLFQLNRDFIEIPEFSVVEANAPPSNAQVEEIFGFIDSEALEKDSEIKGIPESLLVEGQIKGLGFVESAVAEASTVNSIDNEGEIGKVKGLESIIPTFASDVEIKRVSSSESVIDGESIAHAIGCEKTASLESDSLPIDSDVNGIKISPFVDEIFPSIESEEQIDREKMEVREMGDDNEASNAPFIDGSLVPCIDYEDQIGVGSVELEPSLIHEPPSDEEINKPLFKSDDKLEEEAASLESGSLPRDNDVKEIQELRGDREIDSSIQPEDQTERFDAQVQELPSEPLFKCEHEIEKAVSLEPEPLRAIDRGVKEVQEPLAVNANLVPVSSDHQTEVAPQVKVNQLASPNGESHLEFSSSSDQD